MTGMPLAEEVLRLVEALATAAQIQALLRPRKGGQDVRRRRPAAVASIASCGQPSFDWHVLSGLVGKGDLRLPP